MIAGYAPGAICPSASTAAPSLHHWRHPGGSRGRGAGRGVQEGRVSSSSSSSMRHAMVNSTDGDIGDHGLYSRSRGLFVLAKSERH